MCDAIGLAGDDLIVVKLVHQRIELERMVVKDSPVNHWAIDLYEIFKPIRSEASSELAVNERIATVLADLRRLRSSRGQG